MHIARNFIAPNDENTIFVHLSGKETSVALFVQLTANYPNIAPLGFTSGTRDAILPFHGNTVFKSAPALNQTVAEIEAGLSAPNFEMTAVFDDNNLRETDLLAGRWDYARIEMWLMNYKDYGQGEFVIHSGILGEISSLGDTFRAEAVGKLSLTQNTVGIVTSRLCRVREFGDAECKFPLTGTTQDGFAVTDTRPVSSVTNRANFRLTRGQTTPDGFYNNGKITANSGINAGISREIRTCDSNGGSELIANLKRPFPFNISPGDSFTIIAGCDRTHEKCLYYQNALNRRAEDFIPGIENAMRVPPSS